MLYYLSRGYFALRGVLGTLASSPFVKAAAFGLLLFIALEKVLAPRPSAESVLTTASDQRLLAWSILSGRGSSGAAEKAALEYLHLRGERLDALVFEQPGIDLRGLKLPLIGPRGASLKGVMLRGARLSNASLPKAELGESRLRSVQLDGADLTGAKLGRAELSQADLSAALLRGAFLERADLSRARLPGADLRDALASRAEARRANLAGVIAERADWRGADLTAADLSGATFAGAQLAHARLDAAALSSANFTSAEGLDTASFARAWAWRDTPPIGLPEKITIRLCSPGSDDAARKAYLALPARAKASGPKGC